MEGPGQKEDKVYKDRQLSQGNNGVMKSRGRRTAQRKQVISEIQLKKASLIIRLQEGESRSGGKDTKQNGNRNSEKSGNHNSNFQAKKTDAHRQTNKDFLCQNLRVRVKLSQKEH